MKVELVPVLDIFFSDDEIESPKNGPFWNYPDDWNQYNNECLKKIGMENPPKPYLNGSSFYKISELNQTNLDKLILKHIEDFRNGIYDAEEVSPLYGGYVLRIDDNDKYFPQCCADLSDIKYWESLSSEETPFFYQGHPEPNVTLENNKIIFDFSTEEYDEQFVPPITEQLIVINKEDLSFAVKKAKAEIELFGKKIRNSEIKLEINIEEIDRLLIWNDE